MAGVPARPGQSGTEGPVDDHDRRSAGSDTGGGGDVAEEPEASLLGAPNTQRAGEGAGVDARGGEGASGGDPRRADVQGGPGGGEGFPLALRPGVPQRLCLPERGPRGAAGASEATLATPEVRANDEPD